jgi:predicted RNA polymerase sigma factor
MESAKEITHRTVERVARESYGRLVAYISVQTHDLAGAADALSEALLKALTAWPRDGVPHNPEAWLLTTARRSLIDFFRHQRIVSASEPDLLLFARSSTEATMESNYPDERLKLLFVCAHPAIGRAMHTPLMLQAVLGLDAVRIGGAFLVSPKTMGQRLVRAKTKIRDGGIQFEVPEQRELPARLDAVLEAIYAAFGIGWDDMAGADRRGRGLAEEAIWLARVLVQLMPSEAEVHGLLAVMLYCESRRQARRDLAGHYVPLSDQDPKLWSLSLIEEAERHLSTAFKQHRPGSFQLEAAIQSVHADRLRTGHIEWKAILGFYEQLIRISPTIGRRTAQAAAVAEANGPAESLGVLDSMDPTSISTYQPYWAVRAHVLQWLGRIPEARQAYDRAVGLAEDPAIREFLLKKRG